MGFKVPPFWDLRPPPFWGSRTPIFLGSPLRGSEPPLPLFGISDPPPLGAAPLFWGSLTSQPFGLWEPPLPFWALYFGGGGWVFWGPPPPFGGFLVRQSPGCPPPPPKFSISGTFPLLCLWGGTGGAMGAAPPHALLPLPPLPPPPLSDTFVPCAINAPRCPPALPHILGAPSCTP